MEPTSRTQVKRIPKRAVYDVGQIHAILDEAFLCHIGFVAEGTPYVIPTLYVRVGDQLYLHGSAASRMIRNATGVVEVCVTVTLVDGFVLARSAFHHSMNYRSVVLLGQARLVTDADEKVGALHAFTNKIARDRWEEVRSPNQQELKATHVLALPITEASAKVRTGPPLDDEEDYEIPVWAGVVPLELTLGEPKQDGRVLAGVAAFDVSRLAR